MKNLRYNLNELSLFALKSLKPNKHTYKSCYNNIYTKQIIQKEYLRFKKLLLKGYEPTKVFYKLLEKHGNNKQNLLVECHYLQSSVNSVLNPFYINLNFPPLPKI
jgi:hypothetical protein